MLPDRVSNPGPLTYESGALPIALRGPAIIAGTVLLKSVSFTTRIGMSCKMGPILGTDTSATM